VVLVDVAPDGPPRGMKRPRGKPVRAPKIPLVSKR